LLLGIAQARQGAARNVQTGSNHTVSGTRRASIRRKDVTYLSMPDYTI